MCVKNEQHKYVISIPLGRLLWHCVLIVHTAHDRFPTTDPVVCSPNLLRAQIDCWNVSRTNCQVSRRVYYILLYYTHVRNESATSCL